MPSSSVPSRTRATFARTRSGRRAPVTLAGTATAILVAATGCVDSVTSGGGGSNPLLDLNCSIPTNQIFDGGVPVDGIPALTDPEFVSVGDPAIQYLEETPGFPDPRVIGLVADGQAYAVPHNILWWHEIVNLDLPNGRQVAVTYCPLTGSSLVFDRERVGGAELRVSGLIIRNNLIMFDRNAQRSLFPQMMRGARCGALDGMQLEMYPAVDMRWSGWAALHPDTRVVGADTGFDRDYTRYPYGSYEQSRDLLFPQSVPGPGEERRPMKERILGIPSLEEGVYGGLAVPFGELVEASDQGITAIRVESPQGEVLVLWSIWARGGMVFRPATLDGRSVEITTSGGRFVDVETGSEWTLDGRAVDGPLAGASLEPVPDSYVAFWFAWEAMQPDTELWAR
jgi:hypothetical protein